MRESLPHTECEKGCKGALNGAANPSQPLTDGDQYVLGPTDERCRQGAHALAMLAWEAMRDNGFSLSTLGSMIGKDATAAHRVFDRDAPSIALQVIAAALILDKSGTMIRGAAALTGREVIDRPVLTDAEFRRRVEIHARESKSGSAWLEEALGEDGHA